VQVVEPSKHLQFFAMFRRRGGALGETRVGFRLTRSRIELFPVSWLLVPDSTALEPKVA
jgi:hypothetical protein